MLANLFTFNNSYCLYLKSNGEDFIMYAKKKNYTKSRFAEFVKRKRSRKSDYRFFLFIQFRSTVEE